MLLDGHILHIPQKLKDAQDDASQHTSSKYQEDTSQFDNRQFVAVHLVEGFAGHVVILPPFVLQLVKFPLFAQLEYGNTQICTIIGACRRT